MCISKLVCEGMRREEEEKVKKGKIMGEKGSTGVLEIEKLKESFSCKVT